LLFSVPLVLSLNDLGFETFLVEQFIGLLKLVVVDDLPSLRPEPLDVPDQSQLGLPRLCRLLLGRLSVRQVLA
jgi:hypothetical protein